MPVGAKSWDQLGATNDGGGINENDKHIRGVIRRTDTAGHIRLRGRHRHQSTEKGRGAAPASCFDLAFGGGIQSDYNFRGISQTDKGPGVFAYVEPRCNITKDIQLYAGIWGWSTKLPTDADRRIRSVWRHPADLRPGRLRFRLHVLLVSA
jgi:hypothetical protein